MIEMVMVVTKQGIVWLLIHHVPNSVEVKYLVKYVYQRSDMNLPPTWSGFHLVSTLSGLVVFRW